MFGTSKLNRSHFNEDKSKQPTRESRDRFFSLECVVYDLEERVARIMPIEGMKEKLMMELQRHKSTTTTLPA